MWSEEQRAYRAYLKFERTLESKTRVVKENDYCKIIEYHVPQMENGNWTSKKQRLCLSFEPIYWDPPKKKNCLDYC